MNRDILHRMKSIRQTVQISSAQKLLAASKIGKARRLLHASLPYHNNVSRAFAEVMLQYPEKTGYIKTSGADTGKRGLLVLSANRGLAGGYNGNVVRFTENFLKNGQAVDYMIVLGKARGSLLQKGYPVDMEYNEPLDPPSMFTARELSEKINGMLIKGEIDSFDIICTAYRSSAKQEVIQRKLFPLEPLVFAGELAGGIGKRDFIFEPNPEKVIESIALEYLKGYLYGCLVHAWICELTSRVMAMDNAIRNGNDMLEQLSLSYNRQRQAAITQEITEIVAGAAAMA